MSNAETVQKIYESFGKGDVEAILDCLADDVAWEEWSDNSAQKAGVPWFEAKQGKQGVLEFFQLAASFDVQEMQVLSIMDGGDQVAVEIVFDATPPGAGHYRDEEIHLWTFGADGKVTRLRHYTDTAKHIAASESG